MLVIPPNVSCFFILQWLWSWRCMEVPLNGVWQSGIPSWIRFSFSLFHPQTITDTKHNFCGPLCMPSPRALNTWQVTSLLSWRWRPLLFLNCFQPSNLKWPQVTRRFGMRGTYSIWTWYVRLCLGLVECNGTAVVKFSRTAGLVHLLPLRSVRQCLSRTLAWSAHSVYSLLHLCCHTVFISVLNTGFGLSTPSCNPEYQRFITQINLFIPFHLHYEAA
jgi:hypothetical protein